MKAEPVVIDQSLVAGEFVFATHRHRAMYLGKLVRDRAQWLKDNAGMWRRIRDVQQEADSLRRRVDSEIPIEVIAAGPSSHSSRWRPLASAPAITDYGAARDHCSFAVVSR